MNETQARTSGRSPSDGMAITHGIMTFTPDGHALCGPAPDFEGLYHCTAFCGRGVFQSAALGLVLAEQICQGRSRFAVEHLEPIRFAHDFSLKDRDEVRARCYDRYSTHSPFHGGKRTADADGGRPAQAGR